MPTKMNWIVTTVFFVGALASVSATLCHSADDCKEGYCCMGLDWLTMSHKGVCLPMAKLGRPCSELESVLTYYGGKFFKHCPCADGLECAPKKEGFDKETQRRKYLNELKCRKPVSTEAPKEVTTVSPDRTEATVTDRKPDEVTTDSQPETISPETTVSETIAPETIPPETIPPEITTPETIPPETIPPDTIPPETIPPETIPPETPLPDEIGEGPGGEPPREDDCEDWELPCSPKKEIGQGPGGEPPRDDDCEDWELPCSPKKEIVQGPGGGNPSDDDCEDWEKPCSPKKRDCAGTRR